MALNGQLSPSELTSINGGQLEHKAAAAWKAPNGPEDNGLRPSGPNSSYRLKGPASQYGTQEYFWTHQPPLAAFPGTSNHGWGKAIDLAEEWMRSWIDDHGAKFGWRKLEAFSEWWHVNFDGTVDFPTFKVLAYGLKNSRKRVRFYTRRLAYIHKKNGPAYLNRPKGRPGGKFKKDVRAAVREFQEDHGLEVDGAIGIKTAHKISEVFHKQYINRNKRRRLVRNGERTRNILGKRVATLEVKTGGRKRRKRDVALMRP